MKMMRQCLVLVVVVAAFAFICGGIAQAFPNAGADCASCHGQPGGDLDVLPSNLVEIKVGESGQITFDVTDIPSPEAAIVLAGLDDADLMATVGSGWTLSTQDQYASDPFFSDTGPQVLDLAIDANALVGDYGVGVQLAGGPGFGGWASSYDFTIRVTDVPEPATLALLISGFAAVGLVAVRRRRKVS